MTAGERLAQLAGAAGTASALLLLIGAGATAGEALVDYSGVPTGSAATHLLADASPPIPSTSISRGVRLPFRAPLVVTDDEADIILRRQEEELLVLLL